MIDGIDYVTVMQKKWIQETRIFNQVRSISVLVHFKFISVIEGTRGSNTYIYSTVARGDRNSGGA